MSIALQVLLISILLSLLLMSSSVDVKGIADLSLLHLAGMVEHFGLGTVDLMRVFILTAFYMLCHRRCFDIGVADGTPILLASNANRSKCLSIVLRLASSTWE